MFLPIIGDLPFPRGKTGAQGLITPTSTYQGNLEGKAFFSEDTVHSTGVPVVVLCVRNTSGSAITVARKFAQFDNTTAKSCASAIDVFPNVTAGGLCAPLDDAYVVGGSIPDDDLFYVVIRGFCSVLTSASVTNLTAGEPVSSDNGGFIANVNGGSAAGEFVVGTVDYASSYSASTATRMFVDIAALALPPAAG